MKHQDQFITFRSRAGHIVRVRPMQFEDSSLLVDIFENMSSESRYRRFHQTMDQVNPTRVHQEAANIAQADPSRNWGLIAFVDLPRQQKSSDN